jgi:hypothetical protein
MRRPRRLPDSGLLPLPTRPLHKPEQASCQLNLAMCAHAQEEFGEAIAWCNKAIE